MCVCVVCISGVGWGYGQRKNDSTAESEINDDGKFNEAFKRQPSTRCENVKIQFIVYLDFFKRYLCLLITSSELVRIK